MKENEIKKIEMIYTNFITNEYKENLQKIYFIHKLITY